MANIFDGSLLVVGAALVGFILVSGARDRVAQYSLSDPDAPAAVSDVTYDTPDLGVAGSFSDATPVTAQEYNPAGFPVFHALQAGRDNQANNRIGAAGTSARLLVLVPSPAAPVEADRITEDGTLRNTDNGQLRLVVA